MSDTARTPSAESSIIRLLSIAMAKKLRANAGKGHWSTVSQEYLLLRAHEELLELFDAIEGGTADDVIAECADVANFVAMIADNARRGRHACTRLG